MKKSNDRQGLMIPFASGISGTITSSLRMRPSRVPAPMARPGTAAP